MEEPERPADLVPLLRDVGAEILMFSIDYPHWDFDNPHRAFRTRVPPDLHRRIMSDNARVLYGFGASDERHLRSTDLTESAVRAESGGHG
jgi:uncharacterized protein